ncbi:MAG: hypothetical protein K8J08_00965 [Thermoanaerobaculia bacterium]|nr:hypothetical protein [Thermoanaerobaculia bacterium]
MRPTELTLDLTPRARYDVIDVTSRIAAEHGDWLASYPRALYCSYHTTAGYLEQSLCARLQYSRQYLDPFLAMFRGLFPPGAEYRHDQMELRTELSLEQRQVEPRNADSHLTFIGSGLRNCATYTHRPVPTPTYFIDLDGVGPEGRRRRKTSIIAFTGEETVATREIVLPVTARSVASINLRDSKLGTFSELEEWVRDHDIELGRLDLSLAGDEDHVGLTVNEYETLLMQHDLAEVLQNPVRFMAAKGRNMLRDPLAIPGKTLNYARYDLVQILSEAIDAMGFSESTLERIVTRVLSGPAERFLRLRRGVSLFVSGGSEKGPLVCGTYQSPILVQWQKPDRAERRLRASLVRFV